MKMRGLILLTAAMVVTTTSVIMYQPEASIRDAYETACPVEVPYLDLTINQYKEQRSYAESYRAESDVTDGDHAEAGEDRTEAGQDPDVFDDGEGAAGKDSGAVEAGEDPATMPELVEPELDSESDESDGGPEDSVLTYYGNCRITFYDVGPCCCGEYANGYTASGEPAIVGWTVANGSLPFGTKVLIDGQEYCVTDRGVDGDQFDVLVSSHEEALQRGLYYADVYIIN